MRLGGRNPTYNKVPRVNNQAVLAIVVNVGVNIDPELGTFAMSFGPRPIPCPSRLYRVMDLLGSHDNVLICNVRRQPADLERS
jgi:hypothetical protein